MVEAAPKAQEAPTLESKPEEKVAPAPKVLDFSATKNKAPAKEETAPEKKPAKEQAAEKPKQPRDKMSQSKKAPGEEAPIPPKPEAVPKEAKAPEQEQRYIRLTKLVPELQKMLDEKGLAFTPAAEISFIRPKHQQYIAISIEGQQSSTPSLSQAQQLRKLDTITVTGDSAISLS